MPQKQPKTTCPNTSFQSSSESPFSFFLLPTPLSLDRTVDSGGPPGVRGIWIYMPPKGPHEQGGSDHPFGVCQVMSRHDGPVGKAPCTCTGGHGFETRKSPQKKWISFFRGFQAKFFAQNTPYMTLKAASYAAKTTKNNLPQYQLQGPVELTIFFLSPTDSTLLRQDSRFRGGKRDMDIYMPPKGPHEQGGSDHPFGVCRCYR